ncbi:MAG: hypothetical protein H7834_03090 [Magnetococcus sp. YQC-9]
MGHVHGIVLQKAQNNPAALAARGAFFAKIAKNASFEERAKVKSKTLGEESPRPALFFNSKNYTFQAGCGLNRKRWREVAFDEQQKEA